MSARGKGISKSKLAIYAAIAGNFAIAVTKFVAAAITGSSAMLSEAIHSLVDTGNGWLMLLGVHKSQKPPDSDHPFGHGHELYFWTLIVGVLVFAVGGGMSVYEGITHILHPAFPENVVWSYGVLGMATVFEGTTWLFGWKAFNAERGRKGVVQTIHETKDPSSFHSATRRLGRVARTGLRIPRHLLRQSIGITLPRWCCIGAHRVAVVRRCGVDGF